MLPIEWPPVLMHDCENAYFFSDNGIDKRIGKFAQKFPPHTSLYNWSNLRMRCNEIDCVLYIVQKDITKAKTLTVQIV